MSAAIAALRARLDAKHDELLKALHAFSKGGGDARPHSVEDHLFRLLGVVTFWQSLPDPSSRQIADVNRALDMLTVKVARP